MIQRVKDRKGQRGMKKETEKSEKDIVTYFPEK